MKWNWLSIVVAVCILSETVEEVGGKRLKEVERHGRRKQEHKYTRRDPETQEKLMCDMCPPGTHLGEHCTELQTTKCQICPDDHYTSVYNKATQCLYCNEFCSKLNQRMVEGCTKTHNSRCECLPGHYLNMEVCSPHKACSRGKGVTQTGTTEKNTKCRKCKRGYFSSVSSSTAPCQKHRDCSLQNLSIVDRGSRFRDNICGDITEETHPPVVSVLNVTFDTEMSSAVILSSAPSKLDSHSSTLLQLDQSMIKSPDEQLTRATAAIQLSSDLLTTEGSAMGEVVPVVTEEGPCYPTDEPVLAYSDATNFTDIVDQSLSTDNTEYSDSRAHDDDFIQPESQLVDLPTSNRYYTEEIQNDEDVGNSSTKNSILPEFADSVFANIKEEPTSLQSLGAVEIPSYHETSDRNNENRNIHLEEAELTMQTAEMGQQPLSATIMDATDTPTQGASEAVNDKDVGGKDILTNVVISAVVALLTFGSVACVFVAVYPVTRGRVCTAFEQFCARKTSEPPPSYTEKKNDKGNAEDDASVITGSDDTQSVVVDIDDVTDPKAVRPRSLASSTENLQEAFRDAQIYISEHIGTNWKSLSNHLPGRRLTEVQQDCIEEENRRVTDRAMKMLCKWKELNGSKANIERMAKGLDACGQKKIARKVREMGL